jgi:hypothetical protein
MLRLGSNFLVVVAAAAENNVSSMECLWKIVDAWQTTLLICHCCPKLAVYFQRFSHGPMTQYSIYMTIQRFLNTNSMIPRIDSNRCTTGCYCDPCLPHTLGRVYEESCPKIFVEPSISPPCCWKTTILSVRTLVTWSMMLGALVVVAALIPE